MRRRFVVSFGIVAAAIAVGAWSRLEPYHPEPWLADLGQLERATADGYANLEDVVASGRVDPVALHRRTVEAIRTAGSDRRAAQALRAFTDAFGDGHYHVARAMPAWVDGVVRWTRGGGGNAVTPELTGAKACGRLGYSREDEPSLLRGAPGYRVVDDGPFATGVVATGGRRVGVVRIHIFDARRYGSVCEREWERFRTTLAAGRTCDEDCQDEFYGRVVNAELALLDRRLQRLTAAGAEAVVVDLTGNGGGNDWVDPAARLFTTRPLAGGRQEWIRHPHVIGPLQDIRGRLAADLARPELAPSQRTTLASALAATDARIAEARRGCDRRAIWTGGPAAVSCSLLLATPIYTTGLLPYAAPGSLQGLASAGDLFTAADYSYREGAWTGPLIVLVDRRTASAAEYFAALLRDNGAARMVGERTLGAGCGYTYGGIPEVLKESGLTLEMPDCLRRRPSGRNEQEGVAPDVPAGWSDADGSTARGDKALSAIGRALAR